MKWKLSFVLLFLQTSVRIFAQQPNILWVTIEDTSPEFIGCYGNAAAKTPFIDSLARKAVRFTNAFSTGTVCSPTRSTIITGVRSYETGTGHHRSKYPLPDFITGFPAYLRKAGYYTSNSVKTDYNSSSAPRIIKEAWDESSREAGWWKRKPGQPFFAVFNFNESHQSYTMTNPYNWYKQQVLDKLSAEEITPDNEFEMPPFYRESQEMRKNLARVYNSLTLTDKRVAAVVHRLQQEGLADSTIIFFYADHGEGIPRGKTNGIGLGYRAPFVVWFPPMYRHLSPWGTGVITDELVSFEDLAPTLLSLANVEKPSYMKGRAMLGKFRQKPPEFVFGSNDRSDENTDMSRSVINGQYIYSRNFMPFMSTIRWVRYQDVSDIQQQMRKDLADGKLNAVQKQLFEPRPAEYLFDLKTDHWEQHNLVSDKSVRPILEKMRAALDSNILHSKDILLLPEYEMALRSQINEPYQFRLDEQNFPVRKIYAAASLSGFRGADVIKKQLILLKDKDPVIRYWAITGICSQPPVLLKQYQAEIRKTPLDVYPPVAIIGAAICFRNFNDADAKTVLIKYCSDNDPNLVVLALHYIGLSKDVDAFREAVNLLAKSKTQMKDIMVNSAVKVLLYRYGLIKLDSGE